MTTLVIPFDLRGGNQLAYDARDKEILVSGPAGTGKTRTILELLNNLCHSFPGLRALIVRKHQVTLTTTCLVTFNSKVLTSNDGVAFFGGSKSEPAAYRYPNGSIITVGGMDNPEKLLSSEYDIVYANEATELTLEDWEVLTSRLRNGVLRWMRIIGDCNPSYDSHWLLQRCVAGTTRHIRTRIQDNPAYFDAAGIASEAGEQYIATLENLTGTRRQRLLLGEWVGVEDACYPVFDRETHIRDFEPALPLKATIIGADYGSEHESALVAMSIDAWNRRWIRESWALPDTDAGETLFRMIGTFKQRYNTRRGRTDPNQAVLAGRAGWSVAKGGNGGAGGPPRLHRIDLMEPLFYNYPGGRVTTQREEINSRQPMGPYVEPDTAGIFLVKGADGTEELANEIEAYHYVWSVTPSGRTKGVFRMDENRIAAMEYANEEWEEGASMWSGGSSGSVSVQLG